MQLAEANTNLCELFFTAFLSSFIMNSGVWEEVGCAKLWNEWCRTVDTTHLSPTEAFCVFYHLKSNPLVCGA